MQEVEQKKDGRGGRRAGAGRKATGRTRYPIQITLPQEVLLMLEGVENKSLYVEQLIRADRKQS